MSTVTKKRLARVLVGLLVTACLLIFFAMSRFPANDPTTPHVYAGFALAVLASLAFSAYNLYSAVARRR